MSNSKNVPTSIEGKFARDIEALIAQYIRNTRFVVPVMAADPPETEPTNLWMRHDGRLRGRYWNGSAFVYVDYPMRTDITSPPAVPAYPAAPASAAAPQSYATTWDGSWTQTYAGNGSKRLDPTGETNLAFGTDPTGVYSDQRGLVGFDYASIASTLAGSTIENVEITLTLLDAQWGSSEPFFGLHNLAAEPATYDPTSTLLRYNYSEEFVPGETKTTVLPVAYGQMLRDGTAKGLVLEVTGPDRGLYGLAAGVGSGYTPPQLTITYAK